MTRIDEKAILEKLARAYDREEAAQRGEPDPWLDGKDDEVWVSERLACASVALSALPAAPMPGVKATVRALAWEETHSDRGDGTTEISGWEASNGFGSWYWVEQYFGSDSFGFKATFDFEDIADKDDPADAKAAAQADFEARILSALDVPAHPEGVKASPNSQTSGSDA